ncbi:ATP-binding protein [Pseudopedobacter beijingensis]|uniref:histidine kinase n=1 Tax=Pseudopedobacter beijingensis TaxID=1207056 RepID=A0ABW4I841_9SPHI
MDAGLLIIGSFAYLLLLFWVAYRAEKNLFSVKLQPYIYAFSIAVYCSAWAFYGSIGKANDDGLDFLAVYIGPTITAPIWVLLLRRIIRICKQYRITSLADFISARYGKSAILGTVITIVCVLGLVPYIALQIKAIAVTFDYLTQNIDSGYYTSLIHQNIFRNSPLWITVILAVFIIVFSTRKIDSTEKHKGMVAAVALESIVKLVCFLIGGVFIVYFLNNGVADVFRKATEKGIYENSFLLNGETGYTDWIVICLLSSLAMLLLPRQFQVAVVENTDEKHIKKAMWILPLYMLLINFFVLPIALSGNMIFTKGSIEADYAILSLPFREGQSLLSFLVYLGGFSAATGMIIVETIALSTMFSNNLLWPIILRIGGLRKTFLPQAERSIKTIRRFSIVLILILSYAYFTKVAESYSLVSTGLISFAAMAQFAPAVLGGVFWESGNKKGALLGVTAGVVVWFYTLIVPAIAGVGFIPDAIMQEGLFGWELLKPQALFGMTALSPLSHSFFWSMFVNVSFYVLGSVYFRTKQVEKVQAKLFVNNSKYHTPYEIAVKRSGQVSYGQMQAFLQQFLGEEKLMQMIKEFEKNYGVNIRLADDNIDQRFLSYSEKVLSGVIGTASSKLLIESILKEEEVTLNEVVELIKESQQLIALNKELEEKTMALKQASESLASINQQMKEAEILKDEFLYTITHELRTPLTSIRAFSEILYDNPDIDEDQKQHFLAVMIKEIERLSRLITRVLDLEKLESGSQQLQFGPVDVQQVITDAIEAFSKLLEEHKIKLEVSLLSDNMVINADQELLTRLTQNILANAIKYADKEAGQIKVSVKDVNDKLLISIKDNGKGIEEKHRPHIFNKFYQIHNSNQGSGLGLAICKRIVELHQGEIWVEQEYTEGAGISFTLNK